MEFSADIPSNATGMLATPRSLRSPGSSFETAKRVMDAFAAALGLILLMPLLVGCALWIKFSDGGPVLYRQWRAGRDGWLFSLLKFRTMRIDAERDGAQFARSADDRILPGCRWMRKAHIDELPQLWNILIGDMSLVGPRPERPEIMEQLRQEVPRFEWRLAARPGLTGLAQLRNGYTNDVAGVRRKLAWDLRYLRHRSITSDVKLVLATFPRFWDHAAC